jgi:hypothetical protein
MAKPSWTRIKASLKYLKQDELLEVIKVLFDQSDENKRYSPDILTAKVLTICSLPK